MMDAAVEEAGARERRRQLPARLVVYLVLALWLFRGRNSWYGQVMVTLADGRYRQRRAGTCWPDSSWTRMAGWTRGRGGGGSRRTSPRWRGGGPSSAWH